jgi:hypothetical protein
VGDFFEHFSTQGFFDSLVGQFVKIKIFRENPSLSFVKGDEHG